MGLHPQVAFGIESLPVFPPRSKLSVCEKPIHTPAFVQVHRSRLNGFCVPLVGVEDVEGIAIRNLDDLAGKGIGNGWYGEKYEEEKRNYTDCHSLIPGIVNLKTSQITFYSISRAF